MTDMLFTVDDCKSLINEHLQMKYHKDKIDEFWKKNTLIGTFEHVVDDIRRIINSEKNCYSVNMKNIFAGGKLNSDIFNFEQIYNHALKSRSESESGSESGSGSKLCCDIADYIEYELRKNENVDFILDNVNYEKLAKTFIGNEDTPGFNVYYVSLTEFNSIEPTIYFIGKNMNKSYMECKGGSLLSSSRLNEADWYE